MKIIATLGPSTSNKKVIGELINSGADTLRLNFSHFYKANYKNIISIAKYIYKYKKNITYKQDKKYNIYKK